MRSRTIWITSILVLASTGFAVLSWSQGQERVHALQADPAGAPQNLQPPLRGSGGGSLLQQQMELSAQRGAEWLCRSNRPDGRFVYGYLPSLKAVLEGDHFLRQAGAAIALARSARFSNNPHHLAVARQAVLTLLLDTGLDSDDPRIRHTSLPSMIVNRLASAGLLLLAINELPAPGEDLLEQSEQLCLYIAKQQKPDGSLILNDAAPESAPALGDLEEVNYYPGEALYGLMISQRTRPAPWKTDMARKALPFYRNWWNKNRNIAFVPWQTAACAEAFLLTGEKPFAEFANEMNDWICDLQYVRLDPRHPLWVGGFMSWSDGKPLAAEPQVASASYAEGLVEACRIARQAGDLRRFERYRDTLERCLQFVTTLQYTDANTQHFADWYRPILLGGFHASHQDGNLRIDYTQHAVCAMVQYLSYTVK